MDVTSYHQRLLMLLHDNYFCPVFFFQITHYKIPRYVEFVDSFPMTVTLKVQKHELARIMTEKLDL